MPDIDTIPASFQNHIPQEELVKRRCDFLRDYETRCRAAGVEPVIAKGIAVACAMFPDTRNIHLAPRSAERTLRRQYKRYKLQRSHNVSQPGPWRSLSD
jgi:hypothetical protein